MRLRLIVCFLVAVATAWGCSHERPLDPEYNKSYSFPPPTVDPPNPLNR